MMTDEEHGEISEGQIADARRLAAMADGGEGEQPEAGPDAGASAGEADASFVVNLVADAAQAIWAPVLSYGEDLRAEAVARLAPVLEKYDISIGGDWEAEIRAGMFFGSVIFASITAVRAHKRREAEKDVTPKGGTDGAGNE